MGRTSYNHGAKHLSETTYQNYCFALLSTTLRDSKQDSKGLFRLWKSVNFRHLLDGLWTYCQVSNESRASCGSFFNVPDPFNALAAGIPLSMIKTIGGRNFSVDMKRPKLAFLNIGTLGLEWDGSTNPCSVTDFCLSIWVGMKSGTHQSFQYEIWA